MIQYCEQLVAVDGFEPWNAFSNVAFIVAAAVAVRRARIHWAALPGSVLLLAVLATTIGVGSFAWHATHAPWAQLADVVPILCFVLAFLYLALRLALDYSRAAALLACALMMLAILGISMTARTALNGSAAYLPVLGGLLLVANLVGSVALGRTLKLAALIFLCALAARTGDLVACPHFSLGLHWLWHLGNGLVIYLTQKALIDIQAPPSVA
ncbi:MAG: ceramidase domain-containing protein [Gammaproteobacteria bacterium]|nr:ceramidase domain-containing protein [Gammaproteobacteria bacterium]